MRWSWSVVAAGAIAMLLTPLHFGWSPKLVWNASASAPVGLYTVRPAQRLDVPDLMVIAPPKHVSVLLARHTNLPQDTTLLKWLIGLPGQTVCRTGTAITVDGVARGEALSHDRAGQQLPTWQGCEHIAHDRVFLMNWEVPDSLDGRYFGTVPIAAILGHAVPLLTDEDGSGRFRWHRWPHLLTDSATATATVGDAAP